MGKICFQVPPPLVLSLSFPLLFFLAMVQFLLAELNPKFSARQSVGKCTDNNWWSDVVLSCHVTRVLGPAADLCHVSCCAESTCGSVTLSGRRTSADTVSSRRSCPPDRGLRRCAAAAYWPGRTL